MRELDLQLAHFGMWTCMAICFVSLFFLMIFHIRYPTQITDKLDVRKTTDFFLVLTVFSWITMWMFRTLY